MDTQPVEHAFQVETLIFEGPMDLLLHLIERAELEVTSLAIAQVTNQVLEPLMSMQDAFFETDLEHARLDTLKIIKDCVEEVAGLKDAASKNVKSQSQII